MVLLLDPVLGGQSGLTERVMGGRKMHRLQMGVLELAPSIDSSGVWVLAPASQVSSMFGCASCCGCLLILVVRVAF